MRPRVLLAPKGLNVEEILLQDRTGVSKFDVYSFCDLLTKQMVFNNETMKKAGGYFKLNSQVLKEQIRNYSSCVRLLMNNGVVKCDSRYTVGLSSLGYQFFPDIIEHGFEQVEIQLTYKESKKLTNRKRRKEAVKRQKVTNEKRVFLMKPYLSGLLTIEYETATNELEEIYGSQISAIEKKLAVKTGEFRKKRLQLNKDALSYTFNNQKLLVDIINSGEVGDYYKSDESGFRFHTPITRLKSQLRKHLRYDGQRLIELDIKSSQPYLLQLLLQQKFWDGERDKRLHINSIDKQIANHMKAHIHKYYSFMIQETHETLAGVDSSIVEFCRLLEQGNLYAEFGKRIKQSFPTKAKKYNEKYVKKSLLTTLYTYPQKYQRTKYPLRVILERDFPMLTAFLDDIKTLKERQYRWINSYGKRITDDKQNSCESMTIDTGYRRLAILLQRVESKVVLDIVCKNLLKMIPDIPLFTIHDCIMTTEEYKVVVKTKLFDTLFDVIGFNPLVEEK